MLTKLATTGACCAWLAVAATGCNSLPGAYSFAKDQDPFVGLRQGFTVDEAFQTLGVNMSGQTIDCDPSAPVYFVHYDVGAEGWAKLRFHTSQDGAIRLMGWAPCEKPEKEEVVALERVDATTFQR